MAHAQLAVALHAIYYTGTGIVFFVKSVDFFWGENRGKKYIGGRFFLGNLGKKWKGRVEMGFSVKSLCRTGGHNKE